MALEGIAFLLVFIAAFTVAGRSFIVINQYEEGLKFQYGRYLTKLLPGINFIIPFIDVIAVVDMRIRALDVPTQKVITKDNAFVGIDAIIYYKPANAERLVLNVAQYEVATIKISQTHLRAIVGEITFDSLNSEREYINKRLSEGLARLTESWGMNIISAEINEVSPLSNSLISALTKEVRAERMKRATILESEGRKESFVLSAQGVKQATETVAAGLAKAAVNVAAGEAEAIGIVAKEAGHIEGSALTIWEINMWKTVSQNKSSTVLLPYNIKDFIKCLKGIEGGV